MNGHKSRNVVAIVAVCLAVLAGRSLFLQVSPLNLLSGIGFGSLFDKRTPRHVTIVPRSPGEKMDASVGTGRAALALGRTEGQNDSTSSVEIEHPAMHLNNSNVLDIAELEAIKSSIFSMVEVAALSAEKRAELSELIDSISKRVPADVARDSEWREQVVSAFVRGTIPAESTSSDTVTSPGAPSRGVNPYQELLANGSNYLAEQRADSKDDSLGIYLSNTITPHAQGIEK